ncbi:hypothetical protein [Salegentibacter sp. Hel_I_6]|uniref:hypothetical protein n=1 Tax=Salegentibacter sp. Hel_I_6 TaxID=1250278 RepID=UPI00056867F4|nr:hypothetical protein [Salegentibacter sp. Hel_I_6]
MIWLNIKKLELKLLKNELTEHGAYQYLLTILIFITLATQLPGSFDFSSDLWRLLDFTLDVLITIGGTYILFAINSKGDNQDFLKRYFSLAFVHALRLAILLVILKLIYKIIMFVVPIDLWRIVNEFATGDVAEIIYNLIISLIFYFLLRGSFKRVNENSIKFIHKPNNAEESFR